MDDEQAIRSYNAAGDRNRGRLGAIHWPDLPLDEANLLALAEGILDSSLDWGRLAFGDDFDEETAREELVDAWRTDELRARFAPEGVFVRAAFTIRLELIEPDIPEADPTVTETLCVEAEFCVSFVERHHTRPYVDFMGGRVRRISDGMVTRVDPFSFELSPEDAVEWGLNGARFA